jgi:hypothetical protein
MSNKGSGRKINQIKQYFILVVDRKKTDFIWPVSREPGPNKCPLIIYRLKIDDYDLTKMVWA